MDVVDEGLNVLRPVGGVEAQLADDGMDIAAGIVAELDLAGLVLA